jgi:cytochrome c oxidase assembly protein subunit 15
MTARRLAVATLVYTLVVIAWGAYVRASGSGAGCGAHWPLCNGEVVPRPESIETVIELTHRITSGFALVAVVALAVAVFRGSSPGDGARVAAVASVVFMLTEAAVGAGLVLLEYVADNASAARAWWMAGHLMNTFLLLAALAATVWWTGPGAGAVRAEASAAARVVAAACVVTVLLAGASGGVAALGDTLYPASTLAEGVRQDFAPGAALLVRLRVFHPALALVAALTLVLAVPFLARTAGRRARVAGRILTALVVAQLLAGSVNLVLLAPIPLQIVHLVLADLLWLGLVFFLFTVFTRTPGTPVAPSETDRRPSVAFRH